MNAHTIWSKILDINEADWRKMEQLTRFKKVVAKAKSLDLAALKTELGAAGAHAFIVEYSVGSGPKALPSPDWIPGSNNTSGQALRDNLSYDLFERGKAGALRDELRSFWTLDEAKAAVQPLYSATRLRHLLTALFAWDAR